MKQFKLTENLFQYVPFRLIINSQNQNTVGFSENKLDY